MIRIAISAAAFDAIAKTLPLGSVSFERESGAKGRALHLARARSRQQTALLARARRKLQRRHPEGRRRGRRS
jgi:hypothetical protein